MTRALNGPIANDGLAALFGDTPSRANEYRPQTRPEFQRAARDLMAQGLSTDDVARILGITRRGVLDLLAEPPPGELKPRYRERSP